MELNSKMNRVEAPNPPTNPMADPDEMYISAVSSRLSDSKKAHMMWVGLCFQSGKQGHISREFPNKKGKGHQTTKISEMEDQIQQLGDGIVALRGFRTAEKSGKGRAEFSKNGGAQE